MNTISTLIPRQNCPNNPVHFTRVETTQLIGQAIRQIKTPPPTWIQMSTAHIYGDPPESLCTEDSPLGYGLAPFDGYAWERAYEKSVLPNMRKVILRTSFVLGRTGGALQRLSFIVKIGLGGKAGHGKQGISWRLSQKGDFCEGILKSVHFSGIFFWEGVTLGRG